MAIVMASTLEVVAIAIGFNEGVMSERGLSAQLRGSEAERGTSGAER